MAVTVSYRDSEEHIIEPRAFVTNHSEQPVHQLRIESMGDAQPPVLWDPTVNPPDDVLLPKTTHRVRFQHLTDRRR